VSTWPRARPPVDPASTAVLAELDQLIAGLHGAGIESWAAGAEYTRKWVQDGRGVDSVVMVRMSAYRKVLEAAAAGGS
jgi:hypothetical protein